MQPKATKSRASFGLLLSLLVIWLMLNLTMAWQVWVLGLILAIIISFAFKEIASVYTDIHFSPRRMIYYFIYLGLFLKELIKANLHVAHLVLMPKPNLHPAIIRVPTELKTAVGRLALANSITLTPGTLVVEIKADCLFIHCIDVDKQSPTEDVRRSAAQFEKYLKVVYG